MRLLDGFFYIFTEWQMKLLKKDLPDSKFSSCLVLGVWITFFLLGILSLVGIIYPNQIIYNIVDSHIIFFISGVIITMLILLRYFKLVKYETLTSLFREKRNIRQGLLKFIFWSFIIVSPIFSFCFFRTYLYG